MRRLTCYLLHSGQPSAQRLLARVPRLKSFVSSNAVSTDDIVIRFGSSTESDPATGNVFNSNAAILRTSSKLAMARLLRRVGVRFATKDGGDTNGDGPRFTRHYRVPLFDLTPLACFRADPEDMWLNRRLKKVSDAFREVSFTEEKVTMRVIHLAMRTLHALGLDFGLVSIGMTQKGVLHVLDVSSVPVLQGRVADLYAKAIDDFIDKDENAKRSGVALNHVTLGTDVEVMLRNAAGKMVLASNYFPRAGRVGCDDRSVQFDGKRLPLMELRPEPETNPLQLVANLRDTMQEAARVIARPQVEWRAGSMPFRPYCTGGHIHFSNVPFSRQLVCALDNYVGLPAMLVEDGQTAALRRPRYGFLGDVRMKDYGGFEYRTPASFVVDADVTAALFCLAYIVAIHHRELPLADLYAPARQMDFYRSSKENLYALADRNFAHIRQVSTYERYRDYIAPLITMISQRRSWDEGVDVRQVWGIATPVARTVSQRRGARRTARSNVRVFG